MLHTPSSSNALYAECCFFSSPSDVMLAARRVRSHSLFRPVALCQVLELITFVFLSLILYSQCISLPLASAK